MKALSLIIILVATVAVSGQRTSTSSLAGLTEAVKINDQPALRIMSRDGQWIEVRSVTANNETSLVFNVTRLKNFGLGLKPADEGKFYVTGTKLVYAPFSVKEEAFDVHRSEIKNLEIKKMRQGFDALSFGIGDREIRFVLAGTLFQNGNSYNDRKAMRPSLEYFYRAITDFETALTEFEELTKSVH